MKLLDFLSGQWLLKAEGSFPERIVNIAKEEGIFIQNIKKQDSYITFTVSCKGALKLFSLPLPDSVKLSVISRRGLPAILSGHKNRLFLFLCPFILILFLFLSTQIVWHVNVIGATDAQEDFILSELGRLGVKKGALKFTIDQSYVKNQFLIDNENYQWIWVDLRGGTALVNFTLRTLPPEVFIEEDFYNIYSTHDATVTRISATNGVARVKVGDTVLKGQLLIEGTMPLNAEETKLIHASGEVFGNVWHEKSVTIPKKTQIRTPTGNETEHLSVNFSKFNIKLFINSSILYENYDIIEDNRSIVLFGVNFNKKVYREVTVTYTPNNMEKLKKEQENIFVASLVNEGAKVNHTEFFESDNGDDITYTMRALCEVPIARERRMNLGENNSITDS